VPVKLPPQPRIRDRSEELRSHVREQLTAEQSSKSSVRVSRRQLLLAGGVGIALVGLGYLGLNASPPPPPEGLRTETIASGLTIPWSIVFISEDEALVTERPGSVRLFDLGSGSLREYGRVEVAAVGEGGLLGIAVRRRGSRLEVYVYHTYRKDGGLANRVVRYLDEGGLADPLSIVEGIPGASVHDGGRIRFGPDGKLYITTGDARVGENSQDLRSLAGKILRLEPDGRAPEDNPFPGSPVYSYGHRNPQGLDWHPATGLLYATEHGPSGENGRFAHDEVNLVRPAGNYGWPLMAGSANREGFVNPILESGDETWAPSGCSFYSGRQNPEWRNNLLFASLRDEHLHRVVIGEDPSTVTFHEKLFSRSFGRLRDVVEGPDGSLYLLTSNRDGRGVAREGDDRIIRVTQRR